MSGIKTLRFVNTFHGENGSEVMVNEIRLAVDQDIKDILIWYGAHYAGDPYEVFLNGRKLDVDLNGWPVAKVIDGDWREALGLTYKGPRV